MAENQQPREEEPEQFEIEQQPDEHTCSDCGFEDCEIVGGVLRCPNCGLTKPLKMETGK
jgi:Zn finger protein HypA/HybF involved in hydrogenase expression